MCPLRAAKKSFELVCASLLSMSGSIPVLHLPPYNTWLGDRRLKQVERTWGGNTGQLELMVGSHQLPCTGISSMSASAFPGYHAFSIYN